MAETFHCGDCSTGCDTCALYCADGGHVGCIGNEAERAHGDALLEADAALATATSQHTPGPWEMYRRADEDGHRWGVSSPTKGCISCAVTREEDARLIAAAPLMLEALRKVAIIGYLLEDGARGSEVLTEVWAAIRAATGEDYTVCWKCGFPLGQSGIHLDCEKGRGVND